MLGKDQFKVGINIEAIIPDNHSYHDLSSIVMVPWDVRSMKRYPVNQIIYKKSKSFVTLGKGQYKVKIKIKGEKSIYIIPR